MRPDCDYMLFVDDDMFPETEALMRLLRREKPVISPLCTTRIPPVKPAVKLYDSKADQWIPPSEPFPPNTVLTGEFSVGAAFLLIDRASIDALKEYYLSAHDWLEDNRRTFDRLHVRADLRERERKRKEEVRRGFWERDKVLRIWDYPIGENELQLGEDVGLCRKLQRLHIPVSIDTGVTVGHLGQHPYGPWDWAPKA
jgi:hypothetical protein